MTLFLRPGKVRTEEAAARERAMEVPAFFGLAARAQDLASPEQKLLSMPRLFATDAEVLLVERGKTVLKTRRCPRSKVEGEPVHTPALKRSRLIGAVAIAAGRANPEVEATRSVTSVAHARAAPTVSSSMRNTSRSRVRSREPAPYRSRRQRSAVRRGRLLRARGARSRTCARSCR